ncbi:MAG: radical SAM protein [Thermoprotei archaeon]|nr:MAG: radical SAM protein [Thermoprotei archaeon]
MKCRLIEEGLEPWGNTITTPNGTKSLPCDAGIRYKDGKWYRLIYDYVLSRPEDYLSIYQSSCNHKCLFCHSHYFSQHSIGTWMSAEDIVEIASIYLDMVTVKEPRERATMWHASDLCRHCGYCIEYEVRGRMCPGVLKPSQVVLSPQGYGPARNIVSFTGGDLYCRIEFYEETFKLMKHEFGDELWIHIETNGYGLTQRNLTELVSAGLDSVWLDMKAYDSRIYRRLCGTSNETILTLPARMKDLDLIFEVVLLYIPHWVELDQLRMFAELLVEVDPYIPTMLLAYFPEYRLNDPPPTLDNMIKAYKILKNSGLKRVKLGNIGVFCRSREEIDRLVESVGLEAIS